MGPWWVHIHLLVMSLSGWETFYYEPATRAAYACAVQVLDLEDLVPHMFWLWSCLRMQLITKLNSEWRGIRCMLCKQQTCTFVLDKIRSSWYCENLSKIGYKEFQHEAIEFQVGRIWPAIQIIETLYIWRETMQCYGMPLLTGDTAGNWSKMLRSSMRFCADHMVLWSRGR